MKLYTEEQVLEAIRIARTSKLNLDVGIIAHIITTYGILDKLTPIELPSDEEIEKESSKWRAPSQAFREGAKWVIEQIKQQNK